MVKSDGARHGERWSGLASPSAFSLSTDIRCQFKYRIRGTTSFFHRVIPVKQAMSACRAISDGSDGCLFNLQHKLPSFGFFSIRCLSSSAGGIAVIALLSPTDPDGY